MNENYLEVTLKDGTVLKFSSRCNEVDYSDERYCVFKEVDDEIKKEHRVLAIIPRENISYMLNRKLKEQEYEQS